MAKAAGTHGVHSKLDLRTGCNTACEDEHQGAMALTSASSSERAVSVSFSARISVSSYLDFTIASFHKSHRQTWLA